MSMSTVNAVNESSPASTRQAIDALAFFGLTDLFVVAIAVHDVLTRRRLHPATLWGIS